jgi:signal transduction histidine kinase
MAHLLAHRGGALALDRTPVAASTRGVISARAAQNALALATVPVGGSAIWLAVASDHLERPAATALYRCYLAIVPMLVGLYWWRRRPVSRFGPLLIVFGVLAWVISWQSSDWPPAFDLGVLAEGPMTFLTFYLFIAFPSGRLEARADRLLMAAWAVVLGGFFLPWALGSPVIAGGGPLSGCVPACPDNVLQIGSAPELVELLGRWETYTGLVVTVATLAIYASHVRAASRPRRRALIAVASTSLLFLPIFFTYHFSRQILQLDAGTLQAMSWFVVGARILLPLGFLVALLQAELFAGVARGTLLERLLTRPSPERWRDDVARALDDPSLRLGYWDLDSGSYREADGRELTAPDPDGDRAWVEVDRDGRPVAAMLIDSALAEDPELVRAAASATTLAVENGNLEGELRESQARIVAAGDAERRRIERDLHDSAQQRLVALRVHLSMASEQLDGSEHQTLVAELGTEVDEALDSLRTIATGVYPKILGDAGVGPALRSVARNGAMPVAVDDRWQRRHGDGIELAVYYSCVEALQNAAKHAGSDATATVRLTEDDACVCFTVEDDGCGFDARSVSRGAGLDNIADRVSAVGGSLRIDSAPGRGTRVAGRLPG